MIATYTYTQAEVAIVGTKPTIEAMATYLSQGAVSALAFAKYCQQANSPVQKVKHNPSGTVSLTGINGKWGVSLYPPQWQIVADNMAAIIEYCGKHATALAALGEATKTAKTAEKLAAKTTTVQESNAAVLANIKA